MAVIGIDLGTTNSLGAVCKDGNVELIPNRFGSFLTPSVVSVMEDGSIVTGEIAKERLVTHPENTAASFKKDMGTERKFRLGKQTFLPEELSSFIVRSIVDDARDYLKEEIEEVIISVPAYFHDKQRVATKRAGALAGVTVKRIINEPSAAAMASYFDTSEEKLFLVFDFGGGTLDVSIVDCFDTIVEILSVAGDNRLGGDNFHEIMAENFLQEHELQKNGITAKEYAILLKQAERCKRKLSEEETAVMSLSVSGKVYQSQYTNQRLMEESGAILNRIKKVLSHALKDGNLSVQDIDAVILAGGSSKMPLIQSYIQHLFGRIPMAVGHCDELIARGLGIICAVKERREEVKDYVLTDICPFTLGTDTYNEADPDHSYMSPIIERNTVLPCSRMRRYYTAGNNQKKIDFRILQGEHTYADDNLQLGFMSIAVPKKKRGEESVDVRFTYDINGILVVDATVVSTGQRVTKVVSQNMDDAEIEGRMEQLEKLKVHPKDLSENKLVLERMEACYEEAAPDLREQLQSYIRYFEYLLSRQDPRPIARYRNYLEQILEQLEEYDPFAPRMEFQDYQEEWDEDETQEEEGQEEFDELQGGEKKWTS